MRACMLCQLCQPSERPGGAPISCPRLAVPSAPPLARGWCVRLIMHLTLFHATCQRGREKRGGAGGDAASARAQRGRRVTPPHPTSMRQAGLDPGVRPCPPPTQRPAGWPRQAPAAAAARRLGVCGGGGRGGRGVGSCMGGGGKAGRHGGGGRPPSCPPTQTRTPPPHARARPMRSPVFPAPCARPPHALTRLPRRVRQRQRQRVPMGIQGGADVGQAVLPPARSKGGEGGWGP